MQFDAEIVDGPVKVDGPVDKIGEPDGIMAWIQIIQWDDRAHFAQDPTAIFASPSIGPGDYGVFANGLDKTFAITEFPFKDSPRISVPNMAAGEGASLIFSVDFTTHLMWKSTRADSHIVPIRSVNWGFSLSAFAQPAPGTQFNWKWSPPIATSTYMSGAMISSAYPEWTQVYHIDQMKYQPIG